MRPRGGEVVVLLVLAFLQLGAAALKQIGVADDGPAVKNMLESLVDGDEVEFEAGEFVGACNVTITASNVLIRGAGRDSTILDCAAQQSRHFHIFGSSVTFTHLHITGGHADCVPRNTTECGDCQCGPVSAEGGAGGCVFVAQSATFSEVIISKCTTMWSGGGLAIGQEGSVQLSAVSVLDCHAQVGGAVRLDALSTATVSGESRLANNSAQTGGAIHGSENSTITINGPVILAENEALEEGAALYSWGGRIDITNGASLRANAATINGGAVSAHDGANIFIHNEVTLEDNLAASNGGAIFLADAGLHISGRVSLHQNAATDGGAIYVKPGTVVVHGEVTFTSHTVPGRGGALFADDASTVLVDGPVVIRDNHATASSGRGAGFAGYYGTTMRFANGVVCEENTGFRGVCFYGEWDTEIVVENGTTARNNIAVARGGVLSTFAYVTVTIQNNVVFDNNVMSSIYGGAGGHVYVLYSELPRSRGLIVRNGVTFSNGEARYGGAVYMRNSAAEFGNDVNFTGGSSYSGGAAIATTTQCSVVLRGPARIERNSAWWGGAFYFSSFTTARLQGDVLFQENEAGANGGVVNMLVHAHLTVESGTIFNNNYGKWYGGCFFVQEFSSLRLEEGVVVSNTQNEWFGGAVHAVFRSEIYLNGAILVNNRAARNGGAVDMDNSASLVATNARMENNTAGENGGAINAYAGSTVKLTGGTIVSGNTATQSGGGIAIWNDAGLEVDDARIEHNSVPITRATCPLLPCGGGAIKVSDVGTVVLGEGTILYGNKADIGGGLLLSESSTADLRGTQMLMNLAVDGGGLSSVNHTKLTADSVRCEGNAASNLGGCMYLSGEPAELVGQSRISLNTAQNGGGMYLYTGLNLKGTPPSLTMMEDNVASLNGGAIELVGSLALAAVDESHRLVMTGNSAGRHGGAVAISLGAAINVKEADCPSECAVSIKGDGTCNPQCMSASCAWDGGDCDDQMRTAGDDGVNACARDQCNTFRQTTTVQCHPSCFSASCDWHRFGCQEFKDRMKLCPVYDAAVFSSVNAKGIMYTKGGSVAGQDSCNNVTCNQPDITPADLSWTSGAVGPHAVSISSNTSWIVTLDSGGLVEDLSSVALDVWVKIASSPFIREHRGYVVSWETFSLFVESYGDRGFQAGIEAGSEFHFSSQTHVCSNGDPVTVTDEFGIISDGYGEYLPNDNCGFIILPGGAGTCGRKPLSLFFSFLDTHEGFDFVRVYDCQDEECTQRTEMPGSPFSGQLGPFNVTSDSGILLVLFEVDQQVQGEGFTAFFDTRLQDENTTVPGTFAPAEWHHISVSVAEDGVTDLFLDGVHVRHEAGTPLPPNVLAGGFGVGQRFLGPEILSSGRLHASLDELRVWRGVRPPTEDRHEGCANLADGEGRLLVCYDFDEGAGDVVSDFGVGGAGQAKGVVGDKHLPWCTTMDDEGRLLNERGVDTGASWGFCSPNKPRLPASGLDYDYDEMAAVAQMTLSEVLNVYPSCGSNTLQFSGNTALGGNGGAVYQADCDTAADARGLCFFTGMNSGGGGMTMASFTNNSAAGAGGAAYVECALLGTSCTQSMSLVLPYPLSTDSELKVMMQGNQAGTRIGSSSADLATRPKAMLLPTDPNATQTIGLWSTPMIISYVPGQSALDLSVALLDDLQSLVVSAGKVPNGFFVEVLLCSVQGACEPTTALAPSTLHRFSRVDGDPMSRTFEGGQQVVCPVGENEVLVHLSVVGASEIPARTMRISCLPCEPGQSRQMEGSGGHRVWTCASCELNQYVIDPNQHQCQPCPTHSHCNGITTWDDVNGSRWRADNTTGLYILERCPAGHQRVTGSSGEFSSTLQQCKPCIPGLEYIVDPNRGHECEPCPDKVECDGSTLTDPVRGAKWVGDLDSGLYMLESCPPGHQKITESQGVFSPTIQQCKPCVQGLQYIVDPNLHHCMDCPAGALCPDGSVLQPREEGAVWKADNVSGQYLLTSCPPGYQKITESEGVFSPLTQQCKQCAPGTQYIVDPNRHECQDCPAGAVCPDGAVLLAGEEGDPRAAALWEPDLQTGIYLLVSCPAGHQKVTESQGVFSSLTQQCKPCTAGTQYIVDPDEHECQDCPFGAVCPDGAVLQPREEGAIWEAEMSTGLYLLVSCPAGHQKITESQGVFSPLTQQCKPCTPGLQYIVDPNVHECQNCAFGAVCPDGSVLEAGSRIDGQPDPSDSRWGAVWTVDNSTGLYLLQSCPPGHQKIIQDTSGVFSATVQQCKPCTQGLQYIIDPNTHECQDCPLGWPVGCQEWMNSLTAPEDSSVWEVDWDLGRLRLSECVEGSIIVRDPIFPMQDQCAVCVRDTFSLWRALYYDGDPDTNPRVATRAANAQARCLKCVEGVTCPGGAALDPKANFWKGKSSDARRSLDDKLRRAVSEDETFGTAEVESSEVGVYPCPPHACVDGGGCSTGRTGVVCGVCAEGYAMAYGTCTPCDAGDNVTKPILAMVLLFLALVSLYFGGYVPIFGSDRDDEGEQEKTGVFARLTQFVKASRGTYPFLGWGKIIISFYQVLSAYIVIFPVDWPVGQQSMMENSAVSRFDFLSQPGLNCLAGNYSYKERIIVYLMSVPTVLVVLTLPTMYISTVGALFYGGWNQHPRFQKVIHQFLWMTLFFIFIVYPTVSVVSLRSFNCQDIGDFGRKLIADFREDCPRDHRGGFIFVWSLFFSIVYPGGIPLFFFVVMIVYRVPHMARQKMKDAAITALIAMYKRRTAASLLQKLQTRLGIKVNHGMRKSVRRSSTTRTTEKYLGQDSDSGGGSPLAATGQHSGTTPLRSRWDTGEDDEQSNGNPTRGRQRRLSLMSNKSQSRGGVSAHGSGSFKKFAEMAGFSEEALQDMITKHVAPGQNGSAAHDNYYQTLDDMMQETRHLTESQFTGLEKLDDLSEDQLRTLVRFNWLRQPRAAGSGDDPERRRRGSTASVESVELMSPATPFDDIGARGIDAQRREKGVKKLLRRRGSLFGNGQRQEGSPNEPDEIDMMPRPKLRDRVKDIAGRLLEARVIAVPHLEWDGQLGEEEVQAISHIGFLFKNYRVDRWYYELLEITRKLICTAVVAFIFPNSPAQIAVGFSVSFFFLLVAARLNPYVDHRLESMQIWALLALCISLFYGLFLVVQDAAPRPLGDGWMTFLDRIFLVMNASILFYPLLQVFLGSRYAPREYLKRWYRRWQRHVEKQSDENPESWVVKLQSRVLQGSSKHKPFVAAQQRALAAADKLPEERVKPQQIRHLLPEIQVDNGEPFGHSDTPPNGYHVATPSGTDRQILPMSSTQGALENGEISTEDVLGAPINRPAPVISCVIPGLQVDPELGQLAGGQNGLSISPPPVEVPPTLPPGYSEFSADATDNGPALIGNGLPTSGSSASYLHPREPSSSSVASPTLDAEHSIPPQPFQQYIPHQQLASPDSALGDRSVRDRNQPSLPRFPSTRLSAIGDPVTVTSGPGVRTVYSMQDAAVDVVEEGHA